MLLCFNCYILLYWLFIKRQNAAPRSIRCNKCNSYMEIGAVNWKQCNKKRGEWRKKKPTLSEWKRKCWLVSIGMVRSDGYELNDFKNVQVFCRFRSIAVYTIYPCWCSFGRSRSIGGRSACNQLSLYAYKCGGHCNEFALRQFTEENIWMQLFSDGINGTHQMCAPHSPNLQKG